MFKTLYRLSTRRRSSRKWSIARIEAFLSGAPLCPGGGAAHSQGRSRIIYRAAIWMKLDESSPVERKEVERDHHDRL